MQTSQDRMSWKTFGEAYMSRRGWITADIKEEEEEIVWVLVIYILHEYIQKNETPLFTYLSFSLNVICSKSERHTFRIRIPIPHVPTPYPVQRGGSVGEYKTGQCVRTNDGFQVFVLFERRSLSVIYINGYFAFKRFPIGFTWRVSWRWQN